MPRAGNAALALAVAAVVLAAAAAPTVMAYPDMYQYSGCIEGVVEAGGGLGVVPVRICFILTIGEDRPRVSVTTVASPAPLPRTVIEDVLTSALEAALDAAIRLEDAAMEAADSRVVYVRSDEPVACREVYTASDGELSVYYVRGDGGLIPALIEGETGGYSVRMTLSYTDSEGACGQPLLTPRKRAALEASAAAVALGAIAASLWRARSLRFEV